MKHILGMAFGLLLLTTACKKDDTTTPITPTPQPDKKLTAVTYIYENADTSKATYEYDAQGRITRTVQDGDIVNITYNGTEVHITEWRASENREVFNFTGKLNADGNLAEGTSTASYNGVNHRQHTYTYNTDGYLTSAKVVLDNGQTYEYRYFYENGHLTKHDYYQNDNYEFSFLVEYGSGVADRTGFNQQYGFVPYTNLLGKKDTEMATKFTRKRPGSPDWFTISAYTLDADQYAVKQLVTNDEGETYTVLYKYE